MLLVSDHGPLTPRLSTSVLRAGAAGRGGRLFRCSAAASAGEAVGRGFSGGGSSELERCACCRAAAVMRSGAGRNGRRGPGEPAAPNGIVAASSRELEPSYAGMQPAA